MWGEPPLHRGRLSPAHNARFSKPAAVAESAFVAVDPAQLVEMLCVEERIVAPDNTVAFGRLRLQLPKSPIRRHFVKAAVKVRQYPLWAHWVFHEPRPSRATPLKAPLSKAAHSAGKPREPLRRKTERTNDVLPKRDNLIGNLDGGEEGRKGRGRTGWRCL